MPKYYIYIYIYSYIYIYIYPSGGWWILEDSKIDVAAGYAVQHLTIGMAIADSIGAFFFDRGGRSQLKSWCLEASQDQAVASSPATDSLCLGHRFAAAAD